MSQHIQPRIIIHGGAGTISRNNLVPGSPQYTAYTDSLRTLLQAGNSKLQGSSTALDAACYVVSLFEDDPLYNCGRGSVFTRDGKNELEASVMVSNGPGGDKKGVGVAMLRCVRNPVLLARELLLRKEETKHNFLAGRQAEKLAEDWGLEIVSQDWFWTERRWKEHLRGLKGREVDKWTMPEKEDAEMMMEDKSLGDQEIEEYLPQGTVGCVVMDKWGNICAATSTGGMTNKLPGRIGDTPTLGAGFWAEEWEVPAARPRVTPAAAAGGLMEGLQNLVTDCFPCPQEHSEPLLEKTLPTNRKAIGLSGTGNGDYFLRLAAAHNVTARYRFGGRSFKAAVKEVIGREGEMQRAAERIGRWGTGEGEGGFIGINEAGELVWDLNCGGMYRGIIDDEGNTKVAVYWDEEMH
ncbi:nucleophile aminohydrolase [Pyronema omphalodes]|nr:nucleophile aminohydrolase [Pyronema omphalodes]